MSDKDYERLADKIVSALDLALEQKDVIVSDLLCRSLEVTLTRGAGGKDFIERRELEENIQKAMQDMDALRKASKA